MDDEVGIEVNKKDADYVRTLMEEPLIIKGFQEIPAEMPAVIAARIAGPPGKLAWLLNFNWIDAPIKNNVS